MTTTYREDGKTRCPACQRDVAAVREITKRVIGIDINHLVSRHLYQERVELNEVGAPVKYTPGFCPGSFENAKEVVRPK